MLKTLVTHIQHGSCDDDDNKDEAEVFEVMQNSITRNFHSIK